MTMICILLFNVFDMRVNTLHTVLYKKVVIATLIKDEGDTLLLQTNEFEQETMRVSRNDCRVINQ